MSPACLLLVAVVGISRDQYTKPKATFAEEVINPVQHSPPSLTHTLFLSPDTPSFLRESNKAAQSLPAAAAAFHAHKALSFPFLLRFRLFLCVAISPLGSLNMGPPNVFFPRESLSIHSHENYHKRHNCTSTHYYYYRSASVFASVYTHTSRSLFVKRTTAHLVTSIDSAERESDSYEFIVWW